MKINKSALRLYASPEAVINQFLHLPGKERVKNIVEQLTNFTEPQVIDCLATVMKDFAPRHREIDEVFIAHFEKVSNQSKHDISWFSDSRKKLLGAYFTKEYSIQAAALFNPSIVLHPDQQNLKPCEQRFIMSLRATGEGHISSIIFKTGVIDRLSDIVLDEEAAYCTTLKKNHAASYTKQFIKTRLAFHPAFEIKILDYLPEYFTATEALDIVANKLSRSEDGFVAIKILEEVFDTNYELYSLPGLSISEKVIFPNAKAESMGMEDVRFVQFINENGTYSYYGTYTAYDGKQIKTQVIETEDFDIFKIRTIYGAAISDKGMALFPEKIDGKFVMIARQGGEKISIMFSEDLYCWENFETLMEPKYSWEVVQLGNCGSPVKTDEGWLLLTHGVGAMRCYVISAILLDLNDPSKIIGRLDKPLITPDESEREGYVPNVVYTCGFLLHGDKLIIPYAVSDSATGFATVDLHELIAEMKF
jgi:predicted GH43/DUF377 family glycosyl hydrolase